MVLSDSFVGNGLDRSILFFIPTGIQGKQTLKFALQEQLILCFIGRVFTVF